MFCTNCGREVKGQFCTNCGTKVVGAPGANQPAQEERTVFLGRTPAPQVQQPNQQPQQQPQGQPNGQYQQPQERPYRDYQQPQQPKQPQGKPYGQPQGQQFQQNPYGNPYQVPPKKKTPIGLIIGIIVAVVAVVAAVLVIFVLKPFGGGSASSVPIDLSDYLEGQSEREFLDSFIKSHITDRGDYYVIDDRDGTNDENDNLVFFNPDADTHVAIYLRNDSGSVFGLEIGDEPFDVTSVMSRHEFTCDGVDVEYGASIVGLEDDSRIIFLKSDGDSLIEIDVTFRKLGADELGDENMTGYHEYEVESIAAYRYKKGESEISGYDSSDEYSSEIADSEDYDPPADDLDAWEYDYLLPYSDVREVTDANLAGMSARELTYARNEIYARHGYIFNSQELNDYFRRMPWYTPDPRVDTNVVQGIELKNADFIRKYQEEHNLEYLPR